MHALLENSMANWLSRMFTIPRHQRDEINKLLAENPALLSVVNGLKDSLATAAVHAAVGPNADPLEMALAGMAIGQQIERMVPTPATDPSMIEAPAVPVSGLIPQQPLTPPAEAVTPPGG
jgi:hypothetical protein